MRWVVRFTRQTIVWLQTTIERAGSSLNEAAGRDLADDAEARAPALASSCRRLWLGSTDSPGAPAD